MVNPLAEVLQETRRLYEAMYRFDNAAAAELGIHPSDLRCVNALEKGPLSAGEIGMRLGLTSGSVTALINRLEKARFVVKQRSKLDGRQLEVSLQSTFYQRAEEVYGRLGQCLGQQFESLGDADLERGAIMLRLLAQGFDQAG